MTRVALCAAVAALVVVPAAAAKLPLQGVLVAGRSLGGIRLGDSPATVQARWGRFHGVCEGCRVRTWYFTYKKFTQQGAAVEFRRGRVDAVYTVWQPPGWRSETGLVLGAPIPALPSLKRVDCTSYTAFVRRKGNVVTAYFLVAGKLW
jgi:hypothetical protein